MVGIQEDLAKLRMDRGVSTESLVSTPMPQPMLATSGPAIASPENAEVVDKLVMIADILNKKLPSTAKTAPPQVIDSIPIS